MKRFFKKNIRNITGLIAGAVLGYAYYHFIGCSNGSCIISSNPFISTIYGAVMGMLFAQLIAPCSSKQKSS